MKKSSLKKYITLLEAAADSATHARDYWMREHERRVEELLEADNEIAELKADAAANASDYLVRQHELLEADNEIAELKADAAANASDYLVRQHELLEAKNHIAELERRLDDNGELERRLDDNGGLCTLRAKLTAETCQETIKRLRGDNERLWEDNERLSSLLRSTEHNHTFERDHNDTQA